MAPARAPSRSTHVRARTGLRRSPRTSRSSRRQAYLTLASPHFRLYATTEGSTRPAGVDRRRIGSRGKHRCAACQSLRRGGHGRVQHIEGRHGSRLSARTTSSTTHVTTSPKGTATTSSSTLAVTVRCPGSGALSPPKGRSSSSAAKAVGAGSAWDASSAHVCCRRSWARSCAHSSPSRTRMTCRPERQHRVGKDHTDHRPHLPAERRTRRHSLSRDRASTRTNHPHRLTGQVADAVFANAESNSAVLCAKGGASRKHVAKAFAAPREATGRARPSAPTLLRARHRRSERAATHAQCPADSAFIGRGVECARLWPSHEVANPFDDECDRPS